MTITSAFCDRHLLCALEPARLAVSSLFGDVNTIDTDKCTRPGCSRLYTRKAGYFDAPLGSHAELGDMGRKRRCGLNHYVEYMVVSRIDGVLVWVCPFENCTVTEPFGPSEDISGTSALM